MGVRAAFREKTGIIPAKSNSTKGHKAALGIDARMLVCAKVANARNLERSVRYRRERGIFRSAHLNAAAAVVLKPVRCAVSWETTASKYAVAEGAHA